MCNEGELLFARTAEKIEEVYTTGPSSCMAHKKEVWGADMPVHPTSVYASPDLAVAYMNYGGRKASRTVVWPEKKIYVRIYGDHLRMQKLLAAAGYKQGCITGARVKRIRFKDKNRSVLPYIDYEDAVTHKKDDDDHFYIGRHRGDSWGRIVTAGGTTGSISDYDYYCIRCNCVHSI